MTNAHTINLAGFELTMFRDAEDDIITIWLDTHDANTDDSQGLGEVPKLRLVINGDPALLQEDGEWKDER
jgi:hypothetical protein